MLTIFYRFGLQRYEFLCKRPNKNAKICRNSMKFEEEMLSLPLKLPFFALFRQIHKGKNLFPYCRNVILVVWWC
jgi:hypothetical protein